MRKPTSCKEGFFLESDNASGAVGDAESSVNEFHQSPKKLAASNHISKQEAESPWGRIGQRCNKK